MSGFLVLEDGVIEDVVVQETAKPPRIVVVADGDQGIDLDAAAVLARSAAEIPVPIPSRASTVTGSRSFSAPFCLALWRLTRMRGSASLAGSSLVATADA